MLPESEPRVRFAYIPVVPPFAGAGQNEAVVEGYMAALEALGAVRWDPDGAEAAGPVCYLVATGGTEAALLGHYAARQAAAPGEPAIIVAHPGNNSLPASLESLARLQQEGARGRIVYLTAPDDERGLAALASAVGDVAVRSALHSARIGLLGAPSDWLVASMPSADTVSAVWGPEVVPVDMAEVADALARVSAEEIAATAGALVTGATDVREPSEAEISDVARVYAALDAVVRAHDLDALTVRCFDLLLSDKTTGCFALSELTDRGIVAGCEGDLVSTIGLVWARLLTGEVPWMANPSHLDEQSNSLVLAHCTVPRTLVDGYALRSHFESGIGVGLQGDIPHGPVTLLRIGGTMMDELWLAEGAITANGRAENLCRTQVSISLTRGHVSELLHAPLGNHIVLVRGHHADHLAEWWETML